MRRFWLNPADNEPEISGTRLLSVPYVTSAKLREQTRMRWPAQTRAYTVVCTMYTYFNLSSLQLDDTTDHGPRLPSPGEGGKRPKRRYAAPERAEGVWISGREENALYPGEAKR